MIQIQLLQKYKKWLTLSLMLVAIAVTAVLLRSCHPKKTILIEQATLDSLKGLNNDLRQNVVYWKDKANKEHVVTPTIEATSSEIQQYSKDDAIELKIKPKQIVAIHKAEAQIVLNQKLKVDTIYLPGKDVIQKLNFNWSDKWMKVNGTIGDKDSIHLEGKDTIKLVEYWKKNWFLGNKHYYADFSNENPYIEIIGGKSVRLKEEKKRWGIGPSVNYSYPNHISFGISLQYSIIRL